MGPYVTPPADLDWGPIEGIISIGGMIITVIGGLLIAGSVIYFLWKLLFTIVGKNQITKEVIKWSAISLTAGMLCLGGGWYTLIRAGQVILIQPTKEIFNMDNPVDDFRPVKVKPVEEEQGRETGEQQ
jgi:hypothetical protein